jgi:DNA polymerase-3 subunit alpha (Gram-positive type)
MNRIVSIDLETTGLSSRLDKIIEIGAVSIEDGVICDTFECMVNPGRELSPHITNITGIKDSDLRDKPLIKNVMPALRDFLQDSVLLGHNIAFDYAFLKHAFVNEGLDFERTGIDTLKIARAMHPGEQSKKLSDLCGLYNIDLKPHRALNDAYATAELYLKLNDSFYEKEPSLFTPQKLIANAKKQTPISKSQKERLNEIIKRNRINCPYDIDLMTKNEASRYLDILKSEGYL